MKKDLLREEIEVLLDDFEKFDSLQTPEALENLNDRYKKLSEKLQEQLKEDEKWQQNGINDISSKYKEL